jgi:TolA-binding protein
MAKTPLGKVLEKYLQQKVKDTFELEAVISLGEYEGTLNMEDIEKLRKQLNNKTKDLEEIEKTLDSYEKTIEVADFTISTQEGLSLVNPVTAPTSTALLLREKAKESADDLKEVVKEQGKSAIKMVLDGLKNARETLNNIGDRCTNTRL